MNIRDDNLTETVPIWLVWFLTEFFNRGSGLVFDFTKPAGSVLVSCDNRTENQTEPNYNSNLTAS